MKKTTLNHMAMYQNVLAIVKDHQTVWNNNPGMVSTVDQFEVLLNNLSSKLNLQGNITKGVRLEKQAYLDQFIDDMSILKSGLVLHAMQTNNLALRERNKETKSKLEDFAADRLQIMSISLLEDLETYETALESVGISAERIQEFRDKVVSLEERKNSMRQAIIERTIETRNINELEKQINKLLNESLDRFISLLQVIDNTFYRAYQSARKIISHGHGGSRNNDPNLGAPAN